MFKGQKSLRDRAKQLFNSRLPDRNRTAQRRDQGIEGMPLFMWIRSCSGGINRIVSDPLNVRYKYNTLNAATYIAADRLARKYKITHLQYGMLVRYLDCLYPGRADRQDYRFETVGLYADKSQISSREFTRKNWEISDILNEYQCLNVILDPMITSMILAAQAVDLLSLRGSYKTNVRVYETA